jgi:hypothetical protein
MTTKAFLVLVVIASLLAPGAQAGSYSTDATLSLHKDEGTLDVDVRVVRLEEHSGQPAEELIAAPKIKTAPGVPATLYTGCQQGEPDFTTKENVTVDVSWPYPNESGTASCTVTVKLGTKVVSTSKMQLKIEGPGRVPLVVAAQEVDPKSVRVVDEKSLTYVLLEFTGKTPAEVKKLAIDNYGNKVQIRDSQGRLTEGGLSFGAYHDTGMALHYTTKTEAELVAGILRGNSK